MYERREDVWRTPNGNSARFAYRADTNDWNTLTASTGEDEYGLRGSSFSGWAMDIGGYLGSVGIVLAIDNPGLRVVIVEPVPPNADLIRANIELNGLAERVTLIQAAACAPGRDSTPVAYAYTGDETALHHAFVGNSTIVAIEGCTVDDVPCVSLSAVARPYGVPSFLKIDCEGGEWDTLTDPIVASIPVIRGEWHPTNGHTQDDFRRLLEPTHVLTFSGPVAGPGGFEAVLRSPSNEDIDLPRLDRAGA